GQEKKIADKMKNKELERLIHKTIKKVGEDIETMSFNTAISALMICVNEMQKAPALSKKLWQNFLLILAPFAPYLAEELWQQSLTSSSKKFSSVHSQKWPSFSVALIKSDVIKIIVQVNGKLRDHLEVPAGMDQREVEQRALASGNVQKFLAGQTPKR